MKRTSNRITITHELSKRWGASHIIGVMMWISEKMKAEVSNVSIIDSNDLRPHKNCDLYDVIEALYKWTNNGPNVNIRIRVQRFDGVWKSCTYRFR